MYPSPRSLLRCSDQSFSEDTPSREVSTISAICNIDSSVGERSTDVYHTKKVTCNELPQHSGRDQDDVQNCESAQGNEQPWIMAKSHASKVRRAIRSGLCPDNPHQAFEFFKDKDGRKVVRCKRCSQYMTYVPGPNRVCGRCYQAFILTTMKYDRQIVKDLTTDDGTDEMEDVKLAATTSYQKSSKRRNVKETRKRNYRASQMKPHMDVDVSDIADALTDNVMSPIIEEDDVSTSTYECLPRELETTPLEKIPDSPDGVKFLKFLSQLRVPSDLATDEVSFWMSHMENIALLGYHLYKANSLVEVTMAIFSYVKMVRKGSCLMDLYSIIESVCASEPSSEEIEPHTWKEWKGRDVLTAWNLFKTNTAFKKISYLISAAMSITACSIKEIEWSPFGLELVSIKAFEQQLKAVDVLDALLNTFVWCIETGYRVFEQKSLKPILYEDQNIQQYNEKVEYLLAYRDQALSGTLEDGDVGGFEKKVDEALKETAVLKDVQKHGPTAFWLQSRYNDLVDLKYKLVCKHKNAAMKFCPFAGAVTGDTGRGKSYVMKVMMKVGLLAMNLPYDPTRIITKCKGDKYDSTLTSDTLGMFYDDFGHGKPEHEDASPVDEAIRIINNVAAQAVKAELNQKGVVFINVKHYVVSSNHKDLNVRQYTDIPEAVLRRFVLVRIKVKPEFQKRGSGLLDKTHPSLKNNDVPDAWHLTIEECIPYTNKHGKGSYKFGIATVNGVYCEDLGMDAFLNAYIFLAREHAEHQESLLNQIGSFEALSFCKDCIKPPAYCRCNEKCGESVFSDADEKLPNVVEPESNDDPEFQLHVEEWDCKEEVQLLTGVPQYTAEQRERLRLNSILLNDLPRDCLDWEGLEPHLFSNIQDVAVNAVKRAAVDYVNSWMRPFNLWNALLGYSPIKKMTTKRVARELEGMLDDTMTPVLVAMTPDWVFASNSYQRLLGFWQEHSATRTMDCWFLYHAADWSTRAFASMFCLTFDTCIPYTPLSLRRDWILLGLASSSISLFSLHAMRQTRLQKLRDNYLVRRDALSEHWVAVRDNKVVQGALAGATILIGVKLLQMWNAQRKELDPQTDEGPGWFGYMMQKIGLNVQTQKHNSPSEHIVESLKKSNVYWAEMDRGKDKPSCNIFFPRKNVAVFPKHVMYEKCDGVLSHPKVSIKVDRGDKPGSVFSFKVDESNMVVHPTMDLIWAFVPNCPDLRDKSKYLPLDYPVGTAIADFVGRNRDGFFQERITVDCGKYGHKYMPGLQGCAYVTKNASAGTCMAPLVSLEKDACIIGFHIGGKTGQGVAQTILKKDNDHMIAELCKKERVLLSAVASDLPITIMGREVFSSADIHPHSMASKLLKTDVIDLLGSSRLRSQQKSNVTTSLLSEAVETVTGIPNKWGPPQIRPNWKGFNATLEHIVDPPKMFEPCVLEAACRDWLRPLLVKAFEGKFKGLNPLTLQQAIDGIDGCRFLEAINLATSMGFPIFGKKEGHFVRIMKDGKLIRMPNSLIIAEINRLMERWRKGLRAYPVTSSTLKDEPTELGSQKVRVFQAGNVAMTILIRQYFLPIIRFLGMHPLLSEMAVGMNAFGPDWERITQHWEKFGRERTIGWDYSKFDVRMSSQITTAVYSMYIQIARESMGYSEEDLHIMTMMVADIVHPVLDYNGTLMMATQMNTSGNPITVQVNSQANSLYARIAFFTIFKNLNMDYREHVAAIEYGDDFLGTVREGFEKFNFASFREVMASHGIKVTLPNKSEESRPFLLAEEDDFLKRRSNFIPEIGMRIGALAEDSIFKSLHSNVQSRSVTKEQVAISCLETAMHEWFAHGREVYNLRQSQMLQVCNKVNLPIPAVRITFDERVEHWKNKYQSEGSFSPT